MQCEVGKNRFHNSTHMINQILNKGAYLYIYIQAHFLFFIHSWLINSLFLATWALSNDLFIYYYYYYVFKDFIYLFLERREGREKERERNINVWLPLMHPPLGTWPATQACALTGSRTGDPLVHRPVLSPLSHTSQGYILVVILIWFC